MKNTFLKYIKITLALLLFLQVGEVSAQNNLTIRGYKTSNVTGMIADVTVLDQVFGTVNLNGTNRTTDTDLTNLLSTLPTTVAGFGGVQVVIINGYLTTENITSAQADALIAYVKGGGILVASLEGTLVTPSNVPALKYIGEALLCNAVTLTASAANQTGPNPTPAFHPGNGALLLNSGATSVVTTGSYAKVLGVPCANVVYADNTAASSSTVSALDFVVPAYPGTINSCGVNGMALLSGEVRGILLQGVRDNSQSNINYAQLIFDFLYAPSAMTTRRAWSATSTNTNTTCPPALSPPVCAAGTTAPPLTSGTTINNSSCATPYISLNSLVTGSLPSGASLVWYTNNTRTGNPVLDPIKVAASGTYYAFYYDATNNCYSPASAAVTATYTVCPLNIATVCPAVSVDLASRVTDTAPSGYSYTYHSTTPATTANKLTSSVVTTSGTYYIANYFEAQDCYTDTSRPIVVTITDCCATLTPPIFNN
jgi:hypothetical protein